jgi:hypothetical protein
VVESVNSYEQSTEYILKEPPGNQMWKNTQLKKICKLNLTACKVIGNVLKLTTISKEEWEQGVQGC